MNPFAGNRRSHLTYATALLTLTAAVALTGCARQTEPIASVPTPTPTTVPAIAVAPTAAPMPTPAIAPTSAPMPTIIDSDLSLDEALRGKEFPRATRETLVLVEVDYLGYDGLEHRGQLVVHRDLAADVRAIFADLRAANFPIEKAVPVSRYDWSDGDSMADNNTSAFNYRIVRGRGGLSQHALGRAIDINPLYNPCIRDGQSYPHGAKWQAGVKGTVVPGAIVGAFQARGWRWGGDWRQTNITDYQHFEKLAPGDKPRFY